MKKGLFLCLLLSIAFITHAEQLKFVTVLSSPVGTFNKLEEVDPSKSVQSPVINFCTSIGNGGTVTLKGNAQPTINTLNLLEGTTLGGNGANYVLSRITMNKGGVLQGSRLLANTLQVGQSTAGKSENLYTDTLTVAGAKTKTLIVDGGTSQILGPGESDGTENMVWSNQYQTDNACGEDCKNQYLLKQQGGETTGGIRCASVDGTAVIGCGSVYDPNGNRAERYLKNIPFCSDVGGYTGGSYEGKCWMLSSCTLSKVKGTVTSELVYGAGGLKSTAECDFKHNDCGYYSNDQHFWLYTPDTEPLSYGYAYLASGDDAKRAQLCEKVCVEGDSGFSCHTVHAPSSGAQASGQCSMYLLSYHDSSYCYHYTLTCTYEKKPSQSAELYECKPY